MIDCCTDLFNTMQEQKAYRTYVTDALKALSNNDKAERWIEFVSRLSPQPTHKKQKEETRTSEEIINHVFRKFK